MKLSKIKRELRKDIASCRSEIQRQIDIKNPYRYAIIDKLEEIIKENEKDIEAIQVAQSYQILIKCKEVVATKNIISEITNRNSYASSILDRMNVIEAKYLQRKNGSSRYIPFISLSSLI